jgi:hypothetical protein
VQGAAAPFSFLPSLFFPVARPSFLFRRPFHRLPIALDSLLTTNKIMKKAPHKKEQKKLKKKPPPHHHLKKKKSNARVFALLSTTKKQKDARSGINRRFGSDGSRHIFFASYFFLFQLWFRGGEYLHPM